VQDATGVGRRVAVHGEGVAMLLQGVLALRAFFKPPGLLLVGRRCAFTTEGRYFGLARNRGVFSLRVACVALVDLSVPVVSDTVTSMRRMTS
jgi:hypothetical protein